LQNQADLIIPLIVLRAEFLVANPDGHNRRPKSATAIVSCYPGEGAGKETMVLD
jgi:hypothetical protein